MLARGLDHIVASLAWDHHGVYQHDDRTPGATWRALKLAEQLDQPPVADWLAEHEEIQVVVSGWTCTDPPVPVRLVFWVPNRGPWDELARQWHRNPLEMLRRMWRQTKLEAL